MNPRRYCHDVHIHFNGFSSLLAVGRKDECPPLGFWSGAALVISSAYLFIRSYWIFVPAKIPKTAETLTQNPQLSARPEKEK